MGKVGIVVDSTSDMSPAELEAVGVRHVPLVVRFGTEEYRDGIDLTADQFYEKLVVAEELPKTSQPTPAQFLDVYRELAEEGCDEIVVITLSEQLSGTHQSADIARKESPVPVHLVNSLSVAPGLALLVMHAVGLRDAGHDAAAIVASVKEKVAKSKLFVALGTMDYLVKGGRAGKAKGLAASLLNIKPILTINQDGILEPAAKAKGMTKAIGMMADLVKAHSDEVGPLKYRLAYTTDEALVDQLRAALAAAGVEGEEMPVAQVGPVVGTYVGPSTITLAVIPAN